MELVKDKESEMARSNFDTPSPIAVTLDLYVADVRLATADRTGTVVEADTVEVHASTKLGDVTVRRAPRLDEEA